MRGLRGFAVVLAIPASAAAVPTTPMTVEGQVTETSSRWTADGSRIVTEATVHTAGGDVVVSQLGGSVDGIGMRTMPGPELLVPGMRVAIAAHHDVDLANRGHVLVDNVRVLAVPEGYVRTGPTKAGHYLYWASGCIFTRADAAGTKQIPGDAEFGIIESAITTWNTASASCSYLQVKYEGTEEGREVGRDRVNLIKFRDSSWCRPAVDDDPARCYANSAAGITTASYIDDKSSDRDGEIVDADIEINGADFAISNNGVTLGSAPCDADLANTLTHELGHLHGIEHPCLASGDPPRTDHLGRPVPVCNTVSDPAITESTMFNFQDCGETKKASLEAEDIAAVCGIFPRSADPGTCSPVEQASTGCCSASDRPLPGLLLAGMTALMVGRRRRQRRAR
jgi:hypothetical protein